MGISKLIFYYSLIIVFLLSGLGICSSQVISPGFLIERSIAIEVEESAEGDETDSSEKEFTMLEFSFNLFQDPEGYKICFSGLFLENILGFSVWQPPESV